MVYSKFAKRTDLKNSEGKCVSCGNGGDCLNVCVFQDITVWFCLQYMQIVPIRYVSLRLDGNLLEVFLPSVCPHPSYTERSGSLQG